MKNYRINSVQFHTLPRILHTSQKAMCERIGVTGNYMSRHLNDGEFRLSDLLSICNCYHIRMSLFVSVSGEPSLSASPVVPADEWTDIEFRPGEIRKRMDRDGVTYVRIMDTLGCSRSYIDGIFRDDVPLPKLLSFCNSFGFNLSDFISDPTLPRISTHSSDMKDEIRQLRAECKSLRSELAQIYSYIDSTGIQIPEYLRLSIESDLT